MSRTRPVPLRATAFFSRLALACWVVLMGCGAAWASPARSAAEAALDEAVRRYGENDPRTAVCLKTLADGEAAARHDAAALRLYQRLLEVDVRLDGENAASTRGVLRDVADTLRRLQQPLSELAVRERLQRVCDATLGAGDPTRLMIERDLAWTYDELGRRVEARAILERVLPLLERGGIDPWEATVARSQLAVVYVEQGALEMAEPLYRINLASCEKLYGAASEWVIGPLGNLAGLYLQVGDLSRAAEFYQRAITIAEQNKKTDDPVLAYALQGLSQVRRQQGDYGAAMEANQRALHIFTLHGDTIRTVVTLSNGAVICLAAGRPAEAARLLEQAMALMASRGSDDPHRYTVLSNLAMAWMELGQSERARPLLETVLAARRRLLGDTQAETAVAFNNLAWLEFDRGHRERALQLARQAADARRGTARALLEFSSERQRLAWRHNDEVDPYTLFALLGSGPDVAQAALRYKGVVLDSLLDDQAEEGPAVAQIKLLRERLNQLTLETPRPLSDPARAEKRTERDALERQLEAAEGTLARQRGSRAALTVRVAQVQAALAGDAALIEYVRYARRRLKQAWYGAVVIRRDRPPVFVALGDAEALDSAVRDYRVVMRSSPLSSDDDVAGVSRGLYRRSLAPLEAALSGVRRLYVSPDGLLDLVSFAALLDSDGRFAAERWAIRYVACGRELLRRPQRATENPRISLYGDPLFERVGLDVSRGSPVGLERLPGTSRECNEIVSLARQHGWQTALHLRADATETALRAERAPNVLHLATHGFFLSSNPRPASLFVVDNPMLRGGVALSGAQQTFDAWQRGELPAAARDGVVLAAEVAQIDLRGTWLAVLSACDSGSGEIRDGEGVLGLRRGFAFAGVENLLLTLWPVSDRSTADFMRDFYSKIFDGWAPADALSEVQRDWLLKLRQSEGLSAAVRAAGPFILDVRTAAEETR